MRIASRRKANAVSYDDGLLKYKCDQVFNVQKSPQVHAGGDSIPALQTSSEKPKSPAMAERLGAVKFWSEYSSAITIVYNASVKVVDLRLQHKRTGTAIVVLSGLIVAATNDKKKQKDHSMGRAVVCVLQS